MALRIDRGRGHGRHCVDWEALKGKNWEGGRKSELGFSTDDETVRVDGVGSALARIETEAGDGACDGTGKGNKIELVSFWVWEMEIGNWAKQIVVYVCSVAPAPR